MTWADTRASAQWLALREPADATARALELVERLRPRLPAAGGLVIHDLGCGTGAMGRWLAPLLPGPQRWILHDRDGDLLEIALAQPPSSAAGGAEVSIETRQSDISGLNSGDLADASVVTASALLDVLTEPELLRLTTAGAAAGCPLLLTLSVVGRVELIPADPLDRTLAAAFDAHQRRTTDRGRLLGPDAVQAAVEAFARTQAEVHVRPSPWRLGAAQSDIAAEWFTGWVDAACQQQLELAAQTDIYRCRRLAQAAAGALAVTVDHADLLVLPA